MKTVIMFMLLIGHSFSLEVKLKKNNIRNIDFLLSANSDKNSKAYKAIEGFTKANYLKIKDKVFGGRQLGFIACINLYDAKFKTIKDAQGNEDIYCIFEDESYVNIAEFEKFNF